MSYAVVHIDPSPGGLTLCFGWDGTPPIPSVQYIDTHIPWKMLAPFKTEILRGLHDDIAGALRSRLIEIIDAARKEVEEA